MQAREESEKMSKGFMNKHSSPFRQLSTTCFENKTKSNIIKQMVNILKPQRLGACSTVQLTHKPQIHDLPLELYPERSDFFDKSKQQVYERLVENNVRKIRERLEAKVEEETKQYKQCTFKPNIIEWMESKEREDKKQIFERLYKNAKEREEEFEEKQNAKRKQQQSMIKQFQRQKNKSYLKVLNKEKHNLLPIHERIADVISKKVQGLKEIQAKYKANISFQPHLNQNSVQISKNKFQNNMKKNVVDRLLDRYRESKQEKIKLQQKYKQKQMQHNTFHPDINKNYINLQNDVTSRMKCSMSKCDNANRQFTFIPQINLMSELIVKHNRGEENEQEQLFRLVYEPNQTKMNQLHKIQSEYYHQCTFNPQINQISANIVAKPRNHCCYEKKEEVFSFKPEINQKSRLIRSNSTDNRKIRQSHKKQKFRYDDQYIELKECTFKPKINNYRHQGNKALADIQGVPSYMQKIDRIRNLKQMSKNYEEHVFNLQKRYDKRMAI